MIAYPVVVWLGLSSGSPRHVATLLLALMVPATLLRRRASGDRGRVRSLAVVPATILGVLLVAALLDDGELILATPAATNAVLLASFGATLRRGSAPMIERFARLQGPELDDAKQAWCRLWTRLWCGFFVANGATAAWLALAGDLEAWAFFNGLVAYALIGCMLALEWSLRRARFPRARSPEAPDETP